MKEQMIFKITEKKYEWKISKSCKIHRWANMNEFKCKVVIGIVWCSWKVAVKQGEEKQKKTKNLTFKKTIGQQNE